MARCHLRFPFLRGAIMYVTLTFDLVDARSQDYAELDKRLDRIALRRKIQNSRGTLTRLPANLFAGRFKSSDKIALRTRIKQQVKAAFAACGVHGPYFIQV